MKIPRTGRVRTLTALGAFAVCGVALTAAALSDSATVEVEMDGSKNRFDIVVAGSYSDPSGTWTPTAADWRQGNPDAYEVPLAAGDDRLLAPGTHLDGRIAVKNTSPRLAGGLQLTVRDPQPRGAEVDPVSGNFVELFDQLLFTVRDGGVTVLDRVPAADLESYTWPDRFEPGEVKVLDISIEMSSDADNRWQLASTDVQYSFEAVNL